MSLKVIDTVTHALIYVERPGGGYMCKHCATAAPCSWQIKHSDDCPAKAYEDAHVRTDIGHTVPTALVRDDLIALLREYGDGTGFVLAKKLREEYDITDFDINPRFRVILPGDALDALTRAANEGLRKLEKPSMAVSREAKDAHEREVENVRKALAILDAAEAVSE